MKDRSGDTLMRQWEMLRLIPRAPRRISVRQIHQSLQELSFATSNRTIERDLQSLSARFQLVVDESEKPYGWSWAKDANFAFTPKLSTSQSVALLLSQAHLGNLLPATAMDDLMPVFDMARNEVAASGWSDWHRKTAILPSGMALQAPDVAMAVQVNVHRALLLQRKLSGWYRSKGSDDPRELAMHPLGLIVRGSAQYLVCTLRDYPDVRHLALHRLSRTRMLDEPSLQPEGFDFQRYAATVATTFQGQGPIGVVLRFRAAAAEHLRDTPLGKDQVIEALDEGQVRLRATVEDDQSLRWWLLGFGSQVQVEEPAHLRDAIAEELRMAAQCYGERAAVTGSPGVGGAGQGCRSRRCSC